MTSCGAGIGFDRQFGLFLGIGGTVRIRKHARIVHAGFRIVGLQPQTLFHLETRLRDLALRRQRAAEIQSPLGDAGLDPQRGAEFLLGSGPVTRAPQDQAQIVVQFGNLRIRGRSPSPAPTLLPPPCPAATKPIPACPRLADLPAPVRWRAAVSIPPASTARACINASPHWISRGAESGSSREASSKDRIAEAGSPTAR